MGMPPFANRHRNSGGVSSTATPTTETAPNPNPYRFDIIKIQEFDRHTVAWIRYPDCSTFEGIKVLVFAGNCASKIQSSDRIDPHFTKDRPTLIARFRPDQAGMAALQLFIDPLGIWIPY